MFHPVAHHGRASGGDRADAPFIDQGAGLLMRAAQKGIGRTAYAQTARCRQIAQRQPVFQAQRQRLFGIDVLVRLQDRLRHGEMRSRNGQVDHHVQRLVGQQILDRLRLHAVFGRPRLGRGHVHVGDGPHLQPTKQGRKPEIGGRDIAASDDADAECIHCQSPFAVCRDLRAKRAWSDGLSCSRMKIVQGVCRRSAISAFQGTVPSPRSAQPSSLAF